MQIYLLQDGEKRGPFTVYEVTEEVRSERADASTLGWYKDAAEWMPLEDLPATSSIFVEPPPRPVVETQQDLRERMAPERRRSSVRLWARLIDFMLLNWLISITAVASGWMNAVELQEAHLGILLLLGVLMVLLDGFAISTLSTTPGKWMLNVRVVSDKGGKIPLSISFYRALTVWWSGVGFWMFPLNILMMALAQATLLSTGKTPWDEACGLDLTFGKVDKNRIFILIGIFIVATVVIGLVFKVSLAEALEAQKKN